MSARLLQCVRHTLVTDDHPYLNGAWSPVFEEWADDDCPVQGHIPRDLDGVYLRNTENPVHTALGRYHPFDGDGMLCALRLHHGHAAFRNRFVRTRGFVNEQDVGRSLWSGIAQMPPLSERPGWGAHGALKDSSSTDVCVFAGRALSSFYQCGELYAADPVSLEPHGTVGWGGHFPRAGVSAHAQVDPATQSLLWFSYARQAPYLQCGTTDAGGEVTQVCDVPLPGPRLPHAMMFTRNWYVLNDFPLFWDPDLLARNLFVARMHDLPSRFALVPRSSPAQSPSQRRGGPAGCAPGDIRWFEASPTYALHFVQAREDGEEVILDGYRQQCPSPPPLAGAPAEHARMMAFLDLDSLRPQLWRWRFNLRTGITQEGPLDDMVCEFGCVHAPDPDRAARYVYSMLGEPGWFLFRGFVKLDLQGGTRQTVAFGPGVFGSELRFVPRPGARCEDDGWLLTLVTDVGRGRSEGLIYAAQNLEAGPLARIRLPLRIPSGTHACWADAAELAVPAPRTVF